jgi:hypothetical protein
MRPAEASAALRSCRVSKLAFCKDTRQLLGVFKHAYCSGYAMVQFYKIIYLSRKGPVFHKRPTMPLLPEYYAAKTLVNARNDRKI